MDYVTVCTLGNKPNHCLLGVWIVRQVAIRSDPRFMSYDSQIKLGVSG